MNIPQSAACGSVDYRRNGHGFPTTATVPDGACACGEPPAFRVRLLDEVDWTAEAQPVCGACIAGATEVLAAMCTENWHRIGMIEAWSA